MAKIGSLGTERKVVSKLKEVESKASQNGASSLDQQQAVEDAIQSLSPEQRKRVSITKDGDYLSIGVDGRTNDITLDTSVKGGQSLRNVHEGLLNYLGENDLFGNSELLSLSRSLYDSRSNYYSHSEISKRTNAALQPSIAAGEASYRLGARERIARNRIERESIALGHKINERRYEQLQAWKNRPQTLGRFAFDTVVKTANNFAGLGNSVLSLTGLNGSGAFGSSWSAVGNGLYGATTSFIDNGRIGSYGFSLQKAVGVSSYYAGVAAVDNYSGVYQREGLFGLGTEFASDALTFAGESVFGLASRPLKLADNISINNNLHINTYSGNPFEPEFVGPLNIQEKLPRVHFSSETNRKLGSAPVDMKNPHRHHILEVNGRVGEHRSLVREGQYILRQYDIDPLQGVENLVWAPNRGHTITPAKDLVTDLRSAHAAGFSREDIADILNDHGQRAASR